MVAATDVTVLITGETGTGKEVLARALQQESPRANDAFVTLNCAALPESIAESELFGHCKGSFTGANANRLGRLESSDGGTIFLDEVDSLTLPLQAKLLRFLETGEIQTVGKNTAIRVNVRVIAATNCDLSAKIENGEFRKDLFYRLSVVPLEIPPLRERSGDIERLLEYFIEHSAAEHQLPSASFGKSAIQHLNSYPWPGNIRELRNLCERLAILLPGRAIQLENLPAETLYTPPDTKTNFALPDIGIDLENLEIDLINQALARTNGNRSKSARLLGISRDTLIYRIHKHGIT